MRIPQVGSTRLPRTGTYQQFSGIPAGLAAPQRTSRSATRAPVNRPAPSPSPSRSSSRSNSGGGSSSGGSSARSSYASSRGASSPSTAVATPTPLSVNDWLKGDTTYQDQIAQLRKAYSDYVVSQNNDRTQYQNQFGLNEKNLGTDRTNAFDNLLNDYAGRGLVNSGVYGKAYADLQTDYDTRQTQLDTQRNAYLQDLATNLSNFKGDQQTATTSAKQEAIARRAAKYGGI